VDGWITDKLPSWAGGTKWATQQQVMAGRNLAAAVLSRAAALRADVAKIQEPAKSQHEGRYLGVINQSEGHAKIALEKFNSGQQMTEAQAITYTKMVEHANATFDPIAVLIGQDLSVPSGAAANATVRSTWEADKAGSATLAKEAAKYDDPWGYIIEKFKQYGKDIGGVAGSWSWSAFKPLAPWLAVGGVVVGVWLFGPAIKAALAARQARKSLGVGPLPPFGGIR